MVAQLPTATPLPSTAEIETAINVLKNTLDNQPQLISTEMAESLINFSRKIESFNSSS